MHFVWPEAPPPRAIRLRWSSLVPGLALLLVAVAPPLSTAEDMTLDYLCRYNHQPGEPDHLMDVIEIDGGRAVVASNQGLALIDLGALPPGGTTSYLHRLTGINARDVYWDGGEYLYVNAHRSGNELSAGLAVVRVSGNTLAMVRAIEEPQVLYEKMCVSGDHLYVAAHSHGLRIFSITDRANPTLVGSLDEGFTDAFAVQTSASLAYVADGAGGLKVVDLSDPTDPAIVAGEDLATAIGTSEEVTARDGRVYVAAGAAGLSVYEGGDPGRRSTVEVGGAAESMGWVGDYLAVSTMAGLAILDVGRATPLVVAGEVAARRGPAATLRISSGVGEAAGDRVLVANWNFMDAYQLKAAAASTQADISPGAQRVRFPPGGGVRSVSIRNDGAALLVIDGVGVTSPAFTVHWTGGTVMPGESVSFDISYDGSPSEGTGTVRLQSNDPDENPLPIQVFGNTTYLDPGEPAVDFTLPILTRDHGTGQLSEGTFRLSDHAGKIVWFQVYGSW